MKAANDRDFDRNFFRFKIKLTISEFFARFFVCDVVLVVSDDVTFVTIVVATTEGVHLMELVDELVVINFCIPVLATTVGTPLLSVSLFGEERCDVDVDDDGG